MSRVLLKGAIAARQKTPGSLNTKEIIGKIESGYLVDNRNGFKTKKTFSPSSLVYGNGACPRYWYIAFHGAEFDDSVTPAQVANMRNGTLSHERIQKAMKDSGIVLDLETKIVCDDPPIFGYQDAEILWDDAPLPIEIKTTSEIAFTARKSRNDAATYHIQQLLIYMRIRDKDKGAILYENKNNHELFMVPVEMNDKYSKWLDDTFEWCRSVKDASDKSLLPEVNYRANSKVCKNCPVKDACRSMGAGDIKIESLAPLE